MGKSEKTKDTEKAAGAKTPETAAKPEASAAVKPKRGRKPKAGAGLDPIPEAGMEDVAGILPEASPEADTESQNDSAESSAETGNATEEAAEAFGKTVESGEKTEPGPVLKTDMEDVAEISPETVPEADTESQNDSAEEPATETEKTVEETAEKEKAGEPEAGPKPGQDCREENLPVPFLTASGQAVESPLKRMKQEFQQRAQVIKEQMRNIQNSFIMIGFQLYWIRENNMFRVLNYKNIYDYAEKEYGIKRTTCCNFICIIENYAERDENGGVIESIADCYRNYSASQLVAMLGMPEDMRQQVTPDMSVRAINRLRKGGPEPGTVETAASPVEESAAAGKPGDDAEEPAEKQAAVPEDEYPAGEDTEAPEKEEIKETNDAADDTAEIPEGDTACGEEPEATEAADRGTDDAGEPVELAEIDSYSDYQSMLDELDLIMKHVFSAENSVRVKIVCVQG